MSKALWLGTVLTAAVCLVACGDDSSTNTQGGQQSLENEVSSSSGNEKNPGNENNPGKLDESSESQDGSSSSVEESTEPEGESSSSAKSTGSKSSSSSAKSETESSDSDAEKVWSWDTPKENFLNPKITYGTFVDSKRDHKTYKTIEYFTPYCNNVWFAENLNYEMEGSWCYDNDSKKCDVAGRLYTWDAAKKACPEGWRLPSDEDWENIMAEVSKAGIRLKSMTGWTQKTTNGVYDYNGEDPLGFSAIPAGLWNSDSEKYVNAGTVTGFWSSTEKNSDKANVVEFVGDRVDKDAAVVGLTLKSYGFSVRCVRDKQN